LSASSRRAAAAVLGLLLIGLGGCADMDPAYSPIEWGRSVRRGVVGLVGGDPGPPPPRIEAPPAEGRPYPNLATVPRPPTVSSPAAREAEAGVLAASREQAIKSDQALRAQDFSPSLPSAPRRAPPAAAAQPGPGPAAPPAATAEPAETPQAAPPPAQAQAAPRAAPRPSVPASVFMGSVVVRGDRGDLADFQRKVIEDAAAMALRSNARIRLTGGDADDRERVAKALVALGMPMGRIESQAPRADAAPGPAIEIFVDY
jgi:hypothetical protein